MKAIAFPFVMSLGLALGAVRGVTAAEDTAVTGLQVDHLAGAPANIGARPVFSWRMETDRRDARQTAYRIVVDRVWDSGVRESRDSLAIAYAGAPLAPARRYRWQVRVRDERGRWSKPAVGVFTTGTLTDGYWQDAAWIHPTDAAEPGLKVAAFHKAVSAEKSVAEAWLSLASAGVACAFVNGRAVSDAFLEPGLTHPLRRRQACTHDVTWLFRRAAGATNGLAVAVSPSWSRDRLSDRSRPWRKADPAQPGELKAVLLLRFSDGTERRIVTDASWRASYGAASVVEAGIYEGERVDARLGADWLKDGVVAWPNAAAGASYAGAVSDYRGPSVVLRRDLTLEPVSATVVKGATGADTNAFGTAVVVRRYGKGESMTLGAGEQLVVDFGQNASAVPELAFDAAPGTKITIRHAEMLNEGGGRKDRGNDGPAGTPYLANLRYSYAGIDYICRGGGEWYRPSFAFFGYRYVGIVADGPVTVRRLVSVPVSSVGADAEAGTLETGVADVNRLFANCRWGMLSNYLSVPTDCPQRDERVGWTADTQIFAPAGTYLADVSAFLAKWMLDMRDSQREDGCYSQVAPEGCSVRGGITGWTDAGVFVPWTLWRKYGDTRVIDENWDSMCRYMDFLDDRRGHDHHPFGDWLSYESGDVPWLSKEREKWNIPAKEFLDDAYWHAAAVKMADMAVATGRDPTRWRTLAKSVRARFAARNLEKDGTIRSDRLGQCTALVALGFDLLDSDAAKAKTRAALVANIRAHGDRLQTGFLGTSVLMNTLSFAAEAHALAVTLLLQRENPSWLYSVDQGATTIWERWNSYTKKDGFGPVCMNSFNHYAYGAVAEWMFAALAGIREAEPGYRRIRLEPMPDARLGHVKARFRSPMGVIVSEWTCEGGRWHWTCEVPPNAEADVKLPDGRRFTLGAGRHVASSSADAVWSRTLTDGWTFRLADEATERPVTVPHDWAIEKGFLKAGACPGQGDLPFVGKGFYRRAFDGFTPPAGGRTYLTLDGVQCRSVVKLNGKIVGGRPFGYASETIDVTEHLKPSGNVLEVEAENVELSSRWYPGSGIFRDVTVRVCPRDHVKPNTLFVRTLAASEKEATVAVSFDWTGGTSNYTFTVKNPRLWSPECPSLYTLRLFGEDFRYGIRTAVFDPQKGFFLNGKHRQMRGVCMHHDLGPLGAAFDRGAAMRQILLLKEMGCDAIRTSHNPPAAALLDLCDAFGMLVMDEAFDMWEVWKGDYSNFWKDWHQRDLENFVRRDRSHPCVVMWSIGNELGEFCDKTPERMIRIATELNGIVKANDATRPVTFGCWVTAPMTNGCQNTVDAFGANYMPFKYATFLKDNPKIGLVGTETASCVSSRGEYFFPVVASPITCEADLKRRRDEGREKMIRGGQMSGYDLWGPHPNDYPPDVEFEFQEKNPAVYGEFVWTGFDYLGEPDPCAQTGGRSSYFGIFDLAGFPKDRYWLYKAQWRPEEPCAHILPHWNWKGREGEVTPVHVYTSGDEAELFVNGVSQGRQKRGRYQYRFVWDQVRYQPGELRVRTWRNGRDWAGETVRTAGAPVRLKREDKRYGKLGFVTFTLTDKDGNTCPNDDRTVTFKTRSGTRLVALCNGDPASREDFRGTSMKTFHGLVLAVVEGPSDGLSVVLGR